MILKNGVFSSEPKTLDPRTKTSSSKKSILLDSVIFADKSASSMSIFSKLDSWTPFFIAAPLP